MEIPAGAGKVGPAKFGVAVTGGIIGGAVLAEFVLAMVPANVQGLGFRQLNVANGIRYGITLIAAGLALSVVRK